MFPLGLLWFLKLYSLQQPLKTEVVRVAVDWDLAGTRSDHFWFQRRKRVCSTSLHVHLQLLQDLQRVGHLCFAVDERKEASESVADVTCPVFINCELLLLARFWHTSESYINNNIKTALDKIAHFCIWSRLCGTHLRAVKRDGIS